MAWGGQTLQEGGSESEAVIRRLATHLDAMPGAGRPDTVKLIQVSRAGQREEREQDLAALLGEAQG